MSEIKRYGIDDDCAYSKMNDKVRYYMQTSTYTDSGMYRDYLRSLTDDRDALGRLVCDQVVHPSFFFLPPNAYLEEQYFGCFSHYPKTRFRNEDELFITASAMLTELFRLDSRGLVQGKDVTRRLAVSCRSAAVLYAAIFKAKEIPCRCRAGFMDFGNDGTSYMEHWVNEYWNDQEERWVLVDADGYYEYETRYGYSQFDLPRYKFLTAAEAWLMLRHGELESERLNIFTDNPLVGVMEYLFMDLHAVLGNEIFYSHMPVYLRNRGSDLSETEYTELDDLARLLLDPDKNFSKLDALRDEKEHFFILTNPTQNLYIDIFQT